MEGQGDASDRPQRAGARRGSRRGLSVRRAPGPGGQGDEEGGERRDRQGDAASDAAAEAEADAGSARALAPSAADLSPPPGGLPYTISSVRDALRVWILRSRLPARHRFVLGVGYDVPRIEEKRLPTRQELDTVSATMPVVVVSGAGDAGAYNTVALQRAGISWRTKDPAGGLIRRGRIGEPTGVLEGAAHAMAYAKLVPKIDAKERSRLLADSLKLNAPEEPAAPAAVLAAATPLPTPAPAPPPTPVPTPAPAVAAAPPVPPRDAGSPALGTLVSDALAGRGPLAFGAPAPMCVVSADPASADPATLGRLRVVEEVRSGRTVWRRDRG